MIKKFRMRRMYSVVAILLSSALLVASCSTWQGMDNTKKGGAIGVGGGAAAGAAIGKAAGNTALGAIIGAAVGGTAGVLIGKKMDKQAEDIKSEVPNATVERVGEGINVTFNSGILFGFDKSDLTETAKSNIRELAGVLNKYPDTNVRIEGHTDDTGADAYNMKLSERRAKAVTDYLIAQGVSASRVKTFWFGESQPKVANDSEANRSQNRRVEIGISANEKMKADAEKEAGSN
jgi:outer membrane protein OmpA-like peptidoglycan-associated protein